MIDFEKPLSDPIQEAAAKMAYSARITDPFYALKHARIWAFNNPKEAKALVAEAQRQILDQKVKLPDYVVSCCDGFNDSLDAPCTARLLANGEVQGPTCGEPCSWIMKKSGHGTPPFLHPDHIVDEIKKLLLRSIR